MSENRDFGFCPRCGALMQSGICQSCGYENRGQAPSPSQNPGWSQGVQGFQQTQNRQGYPGYPQVYVGPPREKGNKKGMWFALAAAVVLILGMIFAITFYIHSIFKMGMEISESEPGFRDESNSGNDYFGDDYGYDDDYDYDYDDDYGYYEPDENDPYYETITDATRTDLAYGIDWITESIDPDDSEDYCTFYCIYPMLRDFEDEHKYDSANAAIREMAQSYRASYREYSGGCSTYSYVTYMDEEKVSVAFQHDLYVEGGKIPKVNAVNFRVETGEVIGYEEMAELDQDLAIRFRAQDKTQNDGVEYVQDLTDEELLEILGDPQAAVMFYTPVGLEIGFNYEDGWVTVTFKERAL